MCVASILVGIFRRSLPPQASKASKTPTTVSMYHVRCDQSTKQVRSTRSNEANPFNSFGHEANSYPIPRSLLRYPMDTDRPNHAEEMEPSHSFPKRLRISTLLCRRWSQQLTFRRDSHSFWLRNPTRPNPHRILCPATNPAANGTRPVTINGAACKRRLALFRGLCRCMMYGETSLLLELRYKTE